MTRWDIRLGGEDSNYDYIVSFENLPLESKRTYPSPIARVVCAEDFGIFIEIKVKRPVGDVSFTRQSKQLNPENS